MALPVIETYTSNTALGSSSLALTKPSGVSVGDMLLIIVGNDDATNTQQFDTFVDGDGCTWTLIKEQGNAACDCHIAAFYRTADGTEGSSVSVPAQSADDIYGWYIHITGARKLGSPIHKTGQVNTTNGANHIYPSLETVFKDCLAFAVFAYDGSDGNPFTVSGTGWSKEDELEAGTGSANGSGAFAIKEMTDPGDSEDVTFTSSVNDGGCGFQFAIARDGAPSVEVKESILRALDDLWENRGPSEKYTTTGEFVTDGTQNLFVHGYDKEGDTDTYIRIKDLTAE